MGPVVSKQALDRIKSLISSGVDDGVDLLIDGRDIKLQGYENGYFIGPCLFDNVKTNMSIYKEEIFGPVLSIVRADNYDEALRLVKENFMVMAAQFLLEMEIRLEIFQTKQI